MDLGAYSNIDKLNILMERNGINVPRLRGLRLMSQEETVSPDDVAKIIHDNAMIACECLCESDFRINAFSYEISERTRRLRKKYLIYTKDTFMPVDVRWDRLHGKKRKAFKFAIRRVTRHTRTQYALFNCYCGRPDVLYIHARIGGENWSYYGKEVKDQPWFICKVDDAFDSTYCDIYARIDPNLHVEEV